jgi:acetyltransferase-like isoleucine patch superfamily enzyme
LTLGQRWITFAARDREENRLAEPEVNVKTVHETPQEQFSRVRTHVFWETLKRGLRTFLLFRPFVNAWIALRTGSLIHPLTSIDWNVKVGRRCFIGRATIDTLGGNGRIEIGDGAIIYTGCDLFCHHRSTIRIGANVLFTRQAAAVTGNHVFDKRDATIISQGIRTGDITIEDDCWIGYRAILLPGVHIGHGTVVAAGAVVTKDLPPMVVAAGVPAKILRER